MKSYLLFKRTKMLALQFLYKRNLDMAEEGTRAQQPWRPCYTLHKQWQAPSWRTSCEASSGLLCHVLDTSFHFFPFPRAMLFSLVLTFLLLISSSPQHNFQITNNDKNNVHKATAVKHCHLSPLKPLGYSA